MVGTAAEVLLNHLTCSLRSVLFLFCLHAVRSESDAQTEKIRREELLLSFHTAGGGFIPTLRRSKRKTRLQLKLNQLKLQWKEFCLVQHYVMVEQTIGQNEHPG